MTPEYDNLAKIYDPWSAADPSSALTLRFYLEMCNGPEETIVELGIGNGRIAVEIAQHCNKHIVGIDISEQMLIECKLKAKTRGVDQLFHLIKADFQDFRLPIPAKLIIMPFRTFGHLLTMEHKMAALQQVYKQLAPGGKFIFDHWIFNENWARFHNGVPRLMCKTYDKSNAKNLFIWDTYQFNFDNQITDCFITVEEAEDDGTVINRKHFPLSFSWIEPNQVREMLDKVGFEIEELFGSFDKQPFTTSSKEQIWVVKRPAE